MKTFNFYCDESRHLENDGMAFMLLSYIKVPYNQMKEHKEAIQLLKQKHHFYAEIKWTHVSPSKALFYFDLIDYFFRTDLGFRAIIIDKAKVRNDNYDQSFDDFYYKMYYQLLYHKMNMEHKYNVYLDIKDTLSALKVKKLKNILKLEYSAINNLQNIRSHESLFMQLADFLMGAIGYNLNISKEDQTPFKKRLVKRIQSHTRHNLDRSTFQSENKFNLFFIELR